MKVRVEEKDEEAGTGRRMRRERRVVECPIGKAGLPTSMGACSRATRRARDLTRPGPLSALALLPRVLSSQALAHALGSLCGSPPYMKQYYSVHAVHTDPDDHPPSSPPGPQFRGPPSTNPQLLDLKYRATKCANLPFSASS